MKRRISSKNYLNLFEPIIISFIWVLLIVFPLFFGQFEDQINWNKVFRTWITYIPLFILFLLNRFVLLPRLFFNNKRLIYLLSVSGLIIVFSTVSFINETTKRETRNQPPPQQQPFSNNPDHRRPPPLDGNNTFARPLEQRDQHLPQPIPPYLSLFILSVLIVSFDTGLRVSFRLVDTEREKEKLEKENVGTQLAFLRNQDSPHFFMNTLNNIHALVDINTEEAKESIIQLSKLMRHLLYDSEIDKISLQKEFSFIKNYVDLMKLRFSDKVEIVLNLPDQISDKSIPPLLFTSFVENAFKHGISYEQPSFIHISFTVTDKILTFELTNSNPKNETADESSGIGIENSRKRLDLLYGKNYILKTEDKDDKYSIQLSLPI